MRIPHWVDRYLTFYEFIVWYSRCLGKAITFHQYLSKYILRHSDILCINFFLGQQWKSSNDAWRLPPTVEETVSDFYWLKTPLITSVARLPETRSLVWTVPWPSLSLRTSVTSSTFIHLRSYMHAGCMIGTKIHSTFYAVIVQFHTKDKSTRSLLEMYRLAWKADCSYLNQDKYNFKKNTFEFLLLYTVCDLALFIATDSFTWNDTDFARWP